MIWYIDVEHPKIAKDQEKSVKHLQGRRERAARLAAAAGVACEMIHFTEVSLELAMQRGIQAVTISGCSSDWEEYDWAQFDALFDIIRRGRLPVIGFCGGGQLIAMAYGATCGPMRALRPGEADIWGAYHPGMLKERGFLPVHVVRDDPIWQGLGSDPVFLEAHYWEIKGVPRPFKLLASTKSCRVQLIRHRGRLLYGTQFHPESYSDQYPDGRTFLANFFRLAGVLPPA